MSVFTRGAAVAATLLCTLTASVSAQANSTHFNIAAGLTLPTGDFGDAFKAGYHLIAGVGMQQPASALGFRIEGIFTELDADSDVLDVKSRILGLTANALYDLTAQNRSSASSLYVIGGLGYYNSRVVPGSGSDSDFGWNVGGGFKFPLTGFSAYVEARYHTISGDGGSAHFVPISFGLIF